MSKNTSKRTIILLYGGRSGEHEVSIVSAASVLAALDPAKYTVIPIGITKDGRWLSSSDAAERLKNHKLPKGDSAPILPEPGSNPAKSHQNAVWAKILPSGRPIDAVFPVLHGPMGEDGTVQGLLELADLPYVGSGVLGSAVGMDKIIMKNVFTANGLPTLPFVGIREQDWKTGRNSILQSVTSVCAAPYFTKPANLGSSVGISRCESNDDLISGIEEAFRYDRRVIVEQGSDGREIECAVLGNDTPEASVPGEIVASNAFYDYAAKYESGASTITIPADISEDAANRIRELAVRAFIALDLAGMARIDFFLENNETVLLNEVNTLPGFTSISMYPKLWEATGLSYPKLIDRLIGLAIERHAQMQSRRGPTRDRKWHTVKT